MNDWHKSSYSPNGSNCVEVAEGATTAMRDTQHRELGQLEFACGEWAALMDTLKTRG